MENGPLSLFLSSLGTREATFDVDGDVFVVVVIIVVLVYDDGCPYSDKSCRTSFRVRAVTRAARLFGKRMLCVTTRAYAFY